MGTKTIEFFNGEEMICNKCKKGYFKPVNKSVPIDDCTLFICNVCSEQLRFFKKINLKMPT